MHDQEQLTGMKEIFAEDLMDPAEGGPDREPSEASSGEEANDRRAAVALVVCGILYDEVKAVLERYQIDVPVFFLGPAPCIDHTNFERQLMHQLARAAKAARRTAVLIGRCHPDVDGIVARHGATRLAINDCFDALLGKERKHLSLGVNTFFTTPTWLKHWRRALRQGMQWDKEDARQNFGHNERILLLDAGTTPVSDEEILAFFDYTQVPVEPLNVTLENLAQLILGELGHK